LFPPKILSENKIATQGVQNKFCICGIFLLFFVFCDFDSFYSSCFSRNYRKVQVFVIEALPGSVYKALSVIQALLLFIC
jgi:hypothetical protein